MEAGTKKFRRFCIVRSCRNNKGTYEGIRMFRSAYINYSVLENKYQTDFFIFWAFSALRFPTDIARAQQWRDAIYSTEISDQCNSNVSICIEHFNEGDLIGQKRKFLRPNATPSIFLSSLPAANNAVNESNRESTESVDCIMQQNPEHDHNTSRAICGECEQKDQTIIKLKAEVASIQSKLDRLKQINKAWRQKTYHLKKMQSKLDATINELEQENIIDTKLVQALEVYLFLRFFFC